MKGRWLWIQGVAPIEALRFAAGPEPKRMRAAWDAECPEHLLQNQ